MGIIEKLEKLGLSKDYANGSFAVTIELIEIDEALKIKDYFAYYGVALTKASEIKYYLLNEMELATVLAKLQYCKNNNIPVVDEHGNNKSFLFDLSKKNSEWSILYPDADLQSIIPDVLRDKQSLNSNILDVLNSAESIGLNEDNYDRYIELEQTLTLVIETIKGTGDIAPEVSNNLIKLVAASNTYSDEEILFASLVYNQNRSAQEEEIIKNAVTEVIASLKQGGTRTI